MRRLSSIVGRAWRELRGTSVDDPLRDLAIRPDDGVVGEEGEPLLTSSRVHERVILARNVYDRIERREQRLRLLRIASDRSVRGVVELHVPISDTGTHLGRVALDLPRRLLSSLRLAITEPGDRFGDTGFRHLFFDEEALLGEIEDAGLALVTRRGSLFELAKAAAAESERTPPDAFEVEVQRVLGVVVAIEHGRRTKPPEALLREIAARSDSMPRRGPIGRARLRRAIGWVDAVMPGGQNCFRRTLLELRLDAAAADQPIVFGLDVGRTGHVSFKGREDATFDVAFEVTARSFVLEKGPRVQPLP